MARFCPLFSSSSGNSIYIGEDDTHILIDAGVSAKKIKEALAQIGVDPEKLSAIFITHEHSDHISGLHTIAAKSQIPVFASAGTCNAIMQKPTVCKDLRLNVIDATVDIGCLSVSRFPTSHDCPDSSGYRVDFKNSRSAAVCTDTGIITDEIISGLLNSDIVMIESNHDKHMLQTGTYPPEQKLRILSDMGHLSNTACASFLPTLVTNKTRYIVLGHLSQNNNLPRIARNCAVTELSGKGFLENEDYLLYVAPPSGGKLITL